jgi:hypothetical protein
MALTTNTQEVSAGVVNHSSGLLVNDAGGAVSVTLNVGFLPRVFRVVNITDRITYEWYTGMTNPGAVKTAAAGTRTLETTEGVTMGTAALGTGGQVTIPATIILASKTFAWEAIA